MAIAPALRGSTSPSPDVPAVSPSIVEVDDERWWTGGHWHSQVERRHAHADESGRNVCGRPSGCGMALRRHPPFRRLQQRQIGHAQSVPHGGGIARQGAAPRCFDSSPLLLPSASLGSHARAQPVCLLNVIGEPPRTTPAWRASSSATHRYGLLPRPPPSNPSIRWRRILDHALHRFSNRLPAPPGDH